MPLKGDKSSRQRHRFWYSVSKQNNAWPYVAKQPLRLQLRDALYANRPTCARVRAQILG